MAHLDDSPPTYPHPAQPINNLAVQKAEYNQSLRSQNRGLSPKQLLLVGTGTPKLYRTLQDIECHLIKK